MGTKAEIIISDKEEIGFLVLLVVDGDALLIDEEKKHVFLFIVDVEGVFIFYDDCLQLIVLHFQHVLVLPRHEIVVCEWGYLAWIFVHF